MSRSFGRAQMPGFRHCHRGVAAADWLGAAALVVAEVAGNTPAGVFAEADDIQTYAVPVAERMPSWVRREDRAAWLATICLNVGRDLLRRHARQQGYVQDGPIPDLPAAGDTADQALARLATDRVQAALMGLPEAQRIAITLMDLCGFTASQVAQITGAPRGTVLARVHRGRRRLALSMAEPDCLPVEWEVEDEPRP